MNRHLKLPTILVVVGFLTACGQRGPLYLPSDPPPNETQPNVPDTPSPQNRGQ